MMLLSPKRIITLIGVPAACLMFVAAALLPPLSSPARAQASGMAGIGERDTSTVRATVKDIDMETRTLTLVGPQGETKTLKVGEQVQNLAQVKPGDTVVARYYESVAYVLAPPGTKLPDDILAVAGARAAPGEMPAGGVASKIVVTGLVVGVNPVSHTISLVDPAGGEIRTIAVTDPQAQQMMKMVTVGDTITAYVTEAVVAAVEPAR
jgi:hypothetical protein